MGKELSSPILHVRSGDNPRGYSEVHEAHLWTIGQDIPAGTLQQTTLKHALKRHKSSKPFESTLPQVVILFGRHLCTHGTYKKGIKIFGSKQVAAAEQAGQKLAAELGGLAPEPSPMVPNPESTAVELPAV
eukprot:4697985-Amphidinium_carterae.1